MKNIQRFTSLGISTPCHLQHRSAPTSSPRTGIPATSPSGKSAFERSHTDRLLLREPSWIWFLFLLKTYSQAFICFVISFHSFSSTFFRLWEITVFCTWNSLSWRGFAKEKNPAISFAQHSLYSVQIPFSYKTKTSVIPFSFAPEHKTRFSANLCRQFYSELEDLKMNGLTRKWKNSGKK